MAAAKAGGKPWEELVADRLLKPLGMTGTHLRLADAEKSVDLSIATGHRPDADGKLRPVPHYESKEIDPAGSVFSTARDLATWLRFHLNAGEHNGKRLVSETNLRETHSPQTIIRFDAAAKRLNPESNQLSYAMGWVVQDYRGKLVLQHTGLIDGFRVHLTLLPKEGLALAILANREGTRMNLALSNRLVDLTLGLPAKDWNRHYLDAVAEESLAAELRERRLSLDRRADILPSLPAEKLSGEYANPAYGTAKIGVAKAGLVFEWGTWKLPLEHWEGDLFRVKADRPQIDGAFLGFRIAAGKVTGFTLLDIDFARN